MEADERWHSFLREPTLGRWRNLLGIPPWRDLPNVLPWTDRPDAHDELARRYAAGQLTDDERGWIASWIDGGYAVLDGCVDPADLDEVNAFFDDIAGASRPIEGLTLLGAFLRPEGPAVDLPHRQLLELPRDERERIIGRGRWRLQNLHELCPAAARLWQNERLRDLAGKVMGQPARSYGLLAFMHGSQQKLHQDMAVFPIYPHNHLAAAWIACEDIAPSSGPLIYHPGSHREPMFPGFPDYPQTYLRTCERAVEVEYHDEFVPAVAARHPRKEFLGKKGQVLLWHGMLIHGGAPVLEPTRTRRSLAIHYDVAYAHHEDSVLGPFNY